MIRMKIWAIILLWAASGMVYAGEASCPAIQTGDIMAWLTPKEQKHLKQLLSTPASLMLTPTTAYPADNYKLRSYQLRVALRAVSSKFGPTQHEVIKDIRKATNIVDALHGSHTIVRDRGRLYDKWAMLPDARQRISSHYPGVSTPQYEVRFPGMGVVLFGKTGE
ncbi:MAG: hypothetical protein PHW69_03000, partial [Elusimicrobiaceae bacterium]|nr:hypothetical protein [Elusimicrobiaceae bacterium]